MGRAGGFFSNVSSLATTPARSSEAGRRRGGPLLQFIQAFAATSASGRGILIDALAEPLQTRVVLVLDLVQPDRRLGERGAEVVDGGALLLALLRARDRLQRRFQDINNRRDARDRLVFRGGERPVQGRGVNGAGCRAAGRKQCQNRFRLQQYTAARFCLFLPEAGAGDTRHPQRELLRAATLGASLALRGRAPAIDGRPMWVGRGR